MATMDFFGSTFPSSRLNLDFLIAWLEDQLHEPFLVAMGEEDWEKDEDGWWTWE